MKPRPSNLPRCSCGQVTRWSYDELYSDDWAPLYCWHCLETKSMKIGHSDPLLYELLPWDTDRVDRFFEILTRDSVLLPEIKVIRFSPKESERVKSQVDKSRFFKKGK